MYGRGHTPSILLTPRTGGAAAVALAAHCLC